MIVIDVSAVIEVLMNTLAGIQMAEQFFDPDETLHAPHLQARIIHEDFYCNHRYAAATSLTAGGLAAWSVNILSEDASLPRGSTHPSRLASRRFRHEPS